jgi:hypothetical protein
MKKFEEPPIGIILTMPVKFFEATGRTGASLFIEMKKVLESEEDYWNHMLKNLPTQDVLYVYFVWSGKLQARGNLLAYERNKTKRFVAPNGAFKTFEHKNWVLIGGPFLAAPYDIPMKGFQGFRYVTKELW